MPNIDIGESLSAYRAYKRSGYVLLPFAGGWLDQPTWVREDFELWDLLEQYWANEAEKSKKQPPKVQILPRG